MVNCYHRFILWAAELVHPLYKAIKGCDKKQTDFLVRGDVQVMSKSQVTLLSHPVPGAPIAITTHALDCAVHEQLVGGVWQPLAFFSRQLRPN